MPNKKSCRKIQIIVRYFLCAALVMHSNIAFSFETDQYNLPAKPLVDIGEEVSQYTEQQLRKAVNKINGEISIRKLCVESQLRKSRQIECDSIQKERTRLEFLRSEYAVASDVYQQLGAGIPPFTKSQNWLNSHKFTAQPARFKTTYGNSIFAIQPVNYFTISPTVKLYGAQFGTDKIAHLFQQGYTYYQKYNRALANGLTPDKALEKAIRWGQMSERTFYGTLISGVYSNGDLSANYAGLKFYFGLTREIKIGNSVRPAVLVIKDGFWSFNENINLQESLLKPFVSNHFNEAFNPSIFTRIFGLRLFVRRSVKKRSCPQWLSQNHQLSKADLIDASKKLQLWHGEDYGFTPSSNFVTIANTCFE